LTPPGRASGRSKMTNGSACHHSGIAVEVVIGVAVVVEVEVGVVVVVVVGVEVEVDVAVGSGSRSIGRFLPLGGGRATPAGDGALPETARDRTRARPGGCAPAVGRLAPRPVASDSLAALAGSSFWRAAVHRRPGRVRRLAVHSVAGRNRPV